MQNAIQKNPSMGTIPIPQFKMIPLSKLIWPNLNRGEDIQHVKDLRDSIDEEGFMGAIRVFPENPSGEYKVVDSNHTTQALKTMFTSHPDMEAPCLVIWHKDESDVAKKFGFKGDSTKRKTIRYKQISNLKKKFYRIAIKIMEDNDIL